MSPTIMERSLAAEFYFRIVFQEIVQGGMNGRLAFAQDSLVNDVIMDEQEIMQQLKRGRAPV